jgi:hypothetical protein
MFKIRFFDTINRWSVEFLIRNFMGKFTTGKDLIKAVDEIIWEAEKTLLIVSPYIKLDEHFKALFSKHIQNAKVHLLVVFGKNEDEVNRSLRKEDFDFFTEFPNVSIVHVPNLHGKYYANERNGLITSINLYDHSFKNNIEFGVHYIRKRFGGTYDEDTEAWSASRKVADEGNVVFVKRPQFINKKFIVKLGKDYVGSEVLFDGTSQYYDRRSRSVSTDKKLSDFPDEILVDKNTSQRPERQDTNELSETKAKENKSYSNKLKTKQNPKTKINLVRGKIMRPTSQCIRCTHKIPTNPSSPYCDSCFKTWSHFENIDFPEKWCHYCGERDDEISMVRPLCYDCYKQIVYSVNSIH